MRKPSFDTFKVFRNLFNKINRETQQQQQLIPYFISAHPGCKLEHMAELAAETKDLGFQLEQVQDFTPSPMTLATEMYYTGLDPYSLKSLYVARSEKERKDQRKFFFWYLKENVQRIVDTLYQINRDDLIARLFKTNGSSHAKPQSRKGKSTK